MSADPWYNRVLNGYRIGAHLGAALGGQLYEAEQLARARAVVLKVVDDGVLAGRGFRERFERDARALGSFYHPHVVTLYGAGTSQGTAYLATRPVDGPTLEELVARAGTLDHLRVTELIAQVAAALDAAHERGLLHRGLSPRSILVRAREGLEHAQITDFAIADDTAVYGGMFDRPEGTAPPPIDYAAPEQVRGEPATPRTDVYALGAVLFHALTGSAPFSDRPAGETLEAHLNEPVPSVALMDELPAGFDEIFARALAKDPAERYGSASELAVALPNKLRVLSTWRSMLVAGTMAPSEKSDPGLLPDTGPFAPVEPVLEASPEQAEPAAESERAGFKKTETGSFVPIEQADIAPFTDTGSLVPVQPPSLSAAPPSSKPIGEPRAGEVSDAAGGAAKRASRRGAKRRGRLLRGLRGARPAQAPDGVEVIGNGADAADGSGVAGDCDRAEVEEPSREAARREVEETARRETARREEETARRQAEERMRRDAEGGDDDAEDSGGRDATAPPDSEDAEAILAASSSVDAGDPGSADTADSSSQAGGESAGARQRRRARAARRGAGRPARARREREPRTSRKRKPPDIEPIETPVAPVATRKRRPKLPLVGICLLLLASVVSLAIAAGVFDGDDDKGGSASIATDTSKEAKALAALRKKDAAKQKAAERAAKQRADRERAAKEPGTTTPAQGTTGSGGASSSASGGSSAGTTQSWPSGRSAYTAVVFASSTDRAGALDRARRAARVGVPAGVLSSSDFSNLEPGVWVAFAGIHESERQAQRTADRLRRAGLAPQPYTRFVASR